MPRSNTSSPEIDRIHDRLEELERRVFAERAPATAPLKTDADLRTALEAELAPLHANLVKLSRFLGAQGEHASDREALAKYTRLPVEQRDLLWKQYRAMNEYSDALVDRLKLLVPAPTPDSNVPVPGWHSVPGVVMPPPDTEIIVLMKQGHGEPHRKIIAKRTAEGWVWASGPHLSASRVAAWTHLPENPKGCL